MLAQISSCSLSGVDAFPVVVEARVSGGLPGYHVVGLPNAAVREGSARIRSALAQVGQQVPPRKVVINLAPADRRKEGCAFDLPIAVALMCAAHPEASERFGGLLVLGELGLDGSIRAVRGALPATLLAKRLGLRGVLVPGSVAPACALVEEVEVFAADHLAEVVAVVAGERAFQRTMPDPERTSGPPTGDDLGDVRGHEVARSALEISVAGGHNLLLVGPPGMGKTMLARRVPSILPNMSRDEVLETTQIYSAAGLAIDTLCESRPFRAPHHSITTCALIGGGREPRPGEVSLAHNGVLFLDELPEFRRDVLQSLRQPIEDRQVVLGRVNATVELPCSFMTVAAANPCPCGWAGSRERVCTCADLTLERYRNRIGGPLLDRLDLQIYVPSIKLSDLRSLTPGEDSRAVRTRVEAARTRQSARLARFGRSTNAEMSPAVMRETCRLTDSAERALQRLSEVRRAMTPRGAERLVRVARTVADLHGQEDITRAAIMEAASLRALDW